VHSTHPAWASLCSHAPWYEHMSWPVLGSRRPSDSGASRCGQRSSNTTQLWDKMVSRRAAGGYTTTLVTIYN
jgi:hypothetical protein